MTIPELRKEKWTCAAATLVDAVYVDEPPRTTDAFDVDMYITHRTLAKNTPLIVETPLIRGTVEAEDVNHNASGQGKHPQSTITTNATIAEKSAAVKENDAPNATNSHASVV